MGQLLENDIPIFFKYYSSDPSSHELIVDSHVQHYLSNCKI